MTKQSLRKRSVLLSYIPNGYEAYESTLSRVLTLALGEFEDFIPFKSNKGHTRIYVVFRTPKLAQLAISLKKIGVAGLNQHIDIAELQDEDLERLKPLRETRISDKGATSRSNPTESALPANMITPEPTPQPVDHESAMLRDKCEALSRMLQEAQAQRDLARAALALTQQEFNQQLKEAQNEIEVLQNAAREWRERDKQYNARCETIKSECEERLKAINEDCSLRCTAIRGEWSDKLKRDLEVAHAEWGTRLKSREIELKSHHQKEMGHMEAGAQWNARMEEERKQLKQELIAAREIIRVSDDAKEVEITRRKALEHQLEDVRTREQIQPELLRAFLLMGAIEQQTSRSISPQHPPEILTPLSLTDFSRRLSFKEDVLDSAFAGEAKRRRLG